MLLHNRPRACNPARRRSPRNSRKIRQTLAGDRDRATAVPEARAPGTLLQNHPEAATPMHDRRQELQIRRLLRRRDPRREPPRLKLPVSQDNAVARSSKEGLPVDREKIV